jgi:hypothetical protein
LSQRGLVNEENEVPGPFHDRFLKFFADAQRICMGCG